MSNTKKISTQALHNLSDSSLPKLSKDRFDISSTSGRYLLKRHKIPGAKFLNFYNIPNLWKRYLIVVIIGIISSFEVIFFVKSPGNYSSGVSALTQGLARLAYTVMREIGDVQYHTAWIIYNVLFWSLYFIVNIPLFVIGYKMIGKTFTNLSIVYIGTTMIVGFIISAAFPNIQNILLLGNTIPMGEMSYSPDVTLSNNWFAQQGVNVVPFWFPTSDVRIYDVQNDSIRALELFVYGFVHGVISAILCSILFIVGASTGGTDFISFWLSNKGKDLSRTLLVISIATTFLGCTLGSWIPAGIVNRIGFNYQFLFSANLLASFLSAFIAIVFLRHFYPTQKVIRIEIFSNHQQKIIDHLIKIKYVHSGTVYAAHGMRRRQSVNALVTFCLFSESTRLIEEVQKVDRDAFITALPIIGVHGWFYEYRQGDAEINKK